MTQRRGVRTALAAAVVALLVAGGLVLLTGAAAPARFTTAAEVLAAINARNTQVGTARMHIETASGTDIIATTDGVTRFGPPQAYDTTITARPVAGQSAKPLRTVVVDGVGYRMTVGVEAAPGKPWSRSGPAVLFGPAAPTSAPAAPQLLGVVEGDTVDGRPLVGYRIRSGTGAAPFDAVYFLDAAGTLRKQVDRFDQDNSATTTYSDFGLPVDIQAPPADLIGP
ncbi:hypothetical protein [Pseudonocardia sp. GCM10023141]|uniref:hypothetical protein n=1 Tax=Pseudonocardia sp. GCM10023141 TaxID=3252653 RepID=UPI003616E57A